MPALKLSDFNYHLPPELIAQEGLPQRDRARLMVLKGEAVEHRNMNELPEIFGKGDLLVLNDTRVFKAKLIGKKETGGKVDCLILDPSGEGPMREVFLRGSGMRPGGKLHFTGKSGVSLTAEIQEKLEGAKYRVAFSDPLLIASCATLPLPPYIKKTLKEEERYQTVYSKEEGSLAAPTAGLHFTPELMEKLKSRGVDFAYLTLHVGIGTFAPIRAENFQVWKIHDEQFSVSRPAAEKINQALDAGRRVFAVGTTSVRTLEACADAKGRIKPQAGSTSLFIYPGTAFKIKLAGLLTNFHLPKSSLLLLTCAIAGTEKILAAYREAVREKYRFYSLGDAMLILKKGEG